MSEKTFEWNTYIGAKRVRATPMTLGAYNAHRGWPMPDGEDPEAHGYLVEYCNSSKPNHPAHERYISWSPENIFEEDYHIETPRRIELMGLMSSEGRRLTPNPYWPVVDRSKSVRGLTECVSPIDESPFVNVTPKMVVDIKAENFAEILSDFAGGLIADLHVTNVDNIPAEEFAKIYAEAATARRFIKVEIDPNDPDQMASAELLKTMAKTKEMSLSGAYRQPRGLIAGLPMLDEASFYPNGVPMTIYKSKPLGNGLALGTVETLSGPNGKLDFSDALRALKFGYRVQRSGWNGKDMWLSVSNLNTVTAPADKFWSPHNSEYAKNNGGSAEVPPCITMKNAKGQIQMGWLPSQEDCFSSDWFVFDKEEGNK